MNAFLNISVGILTAFLIQSCGKEKKKHQISSDGFMVHVSEDSVGESGSLDSGANNDTLVSVDGHENTGATAPDEKAEKTSGDESPDSGATLISHSAYAAQRAEVTQLIRSYSFKDDLKPEMDRPVCDKDQASCQPGIEEIALADNEEEVPSWQVRVCSSQTYEMKKNHQEFAVLEPDHDVLWPGALVQGASLTTGTLDPVLVSARAPGVVSLAIQGNDGKSFSRVVENPDLKSVSDALNQILHEKKDQKFPAKFYLQTRSYYSDEQLATSVGVGFGASFAGFGGGVNVSVDKKKARQSNRVVLELTQKYFTATFTPEKGAEFFKKEISADELRPFTSDDNPMTYISSVTWGRRLYFVFESYASIDQLKVAVELYFNYLFFKVRTKVSHEHLNIIKNSSIRVMAVGGNASEIMEAIMPDSHGNDTSQAFDLKKLKEYLIKGAEYSETSMGVPVSYTVRNLGDATAVKIGLATEYTKRDCELKHRNDDLWTLDVEILSINVNQECRNKPVFYHLSLDSGHPDVKWQSVARGQIDPENWVQGKSHFVYSGRRFQVAQNPGQTLTVRAEVDTNQFTSLLEYSSYKLLEKGSFLEWEGEHLNGEVISKSRETPCKPVMDYRLRWLYKG